MQCYTFVVGEKKILFLVMTSKILLKLIKKLVLFEIAQFRLIFFIGV